MVTKRAVYRRAQRKTDKAVKEAVADLGDPNKEGNDSALLRQGARRPRVRVNKAFHPYLTERQQKVLNGKVRTNRTWGRMLKMMEDTGETMEQFVEGLSNEEIVRGQIKDKNGKFTGAPPKWVPRAFHRACVAELMRRGKRLWQENYLQAIESMTAVATGQIAGTTPGERIRAAQFVIERLEGKVPETLVITNEQPWELVIDDIIADVDDGQVARAQKLLNSAEAVRQEAHDPRDPIVDAEIVEDDPPRPVRSRSKVSKRNIATGRKRT
jgi:hypothetical protein